MGRPGGIISPLLANVALHGLKTAIAAISRRYGVAVIPADHNWAVRGPGYGTFLNTNGK